MRCMENGQDTFMEASSLQDAPAASGLSGR